MSMVYILLPISILLALAGLFAFLWGVRNEQFDDLVTPAMRVLFDDESQQEKKSDQD